MTIELSIPELNEDQIMVIITAIYCIATIAIVLENRKSNKLMREEIREMHRPIVSVYFTVNEGLGVLRIKNTGDMIAEHLSIECDEDLFEEDEYCTSKETTEKMLSSEINVGPGEYFDLGLGLPNKLVVQSRSRVIKIRYQSKEETYYEESMVNFSQYRWARLEPNKYEKIEKGLEKISNSLERMNQQ